MATSAGNVGIVIRPLFIPPELPRLDARKTTAALRVPYEWGSFPTYLAAFFVPMIRQQAVLRMSIRYAMLLDGGFTYNSQACLRTGSHGRTAQIVSLESEADPQCRRSSLVNT